MSVPELPEDFDVFAIREHPIAALFPMLTDAELRDLGHDIQDRGLESPVIVCRVDDEWLLLDGRNRRAACRMVGAECSVKAYDRVGGYAGFIVSQNLKRRHMNDSQRAVVAAEIANLSHGQTATEIQQGRKAECSIEHSEEPVTLDQSAKMLNVSKAAVRRASKAIAAGAPELVSAMKAGKVTVSAAATVAKLPVEQQRKAVAENRVTEVARETREAAGVAVRLPPDASDDAHPYPYGDPADDEPFEVDADVSDAIHELEDLARKFRRHGRNTQSLRDALSERIRAWSAIDSLHLEWQR